MLDSIFSRETFAAVTSNASPHLFLFKAADICECLKLNSSGLYCRDDDMSYSVTVSRSHRSSFIHRKKKKKILCDCSKVILLLIFCF